MALKNIRIGTDQRFALSLSNAGKKVNMNDVEVLHLCMYSNDQRSNDGSIGYAVNADDATVLDLLWPAKSQSYLGSHSVHGTIRYAGAVASFDIPAVNVVSLTSEADISTDAIVLEAPVGTEGLTATISIYGMGPQGPKGDPGERGSKGDKGDKGDKMTYADLTQEEKEDLYEGGASLIKPLLATKQNTLTDTDGGYGQRVAELEKEKANLQHQHTVADITNFPELYYDATAFFTSGAYPSDKYEELLEAVKAKRTVYATVDETGHISYVFFMSSANSDGSSSRVLLTTIFADGSYLYLNTFVLQQSGMTPLRESITGKADKATTLAGYGIGDAYTKSELDALLKGKQSILTDTDGGYGQRVAELEKEGIASQEKLTELEKEIRNLNIEEARKNDYELAGNGSYSPNTNYISSGDMYVGDDLQYITDYKGGIFCYDAYSKFLGRVVSGNPLLGGTAYVRINWKKTQDAPYFYSHYTLRLSIYEQTKRFETVENSIVSQNSEISSIKNTIYGALYKEIFKNQNLELNYRIDYELAGNGSYSPNTNYISSGDMYVGDDLQYITDYKGGIFCYDAYDKFLGRVVSGNPLLEGTAYVRINWKKTQDAPYFYSIDDNSIQEALELIYRDYRVNGDDMLGYELEKNGTVSVSPNYRTSQSIKLEDGKNYICNRTANYYYYDENLQFLGRIKTNKRTVFNKNSYTGAVFMRTNTSISDPIEIYEVDSNNNPVTQKIIFKGYAENVINGPASISADETIESNINIDLPKVSSSIVARFKTNQSLYKQSENVELFRIGSVARVNLVPRELTGDSIYCDKSEVDISVIFGSTQKTIPLRLNNYGKDLFSMRIKYPIVNVTPNGLTEMVTPMPAAYEGMYIEKTDTQFIIHNGDDSVFKSWMLSNYTDIDAFVEALKADTSVTDVFEIKKYGCEGMTFSEINNFEKILLCKEHTEILYKQGSDSPSYTGNVYWDSYPTIIRSSDIGYEHILKVNYRVINGVIKNAYVSLDGMFLRFNNVKSSALNMKLTANLDGIISHVTGVSVLPYKPIMTPMISMQHSIHVNENLENTSMVTTTMRQYDMLAYLRKKGFVGQNYDEYMASIRGALVIDKPTYCLTFDDYQRSIWTNKEIRDVFNQFRAKPTLIYLFAAEDFSGATPPSYALSTEDYKAAKDSGWDIICHGFCMYTDMLSYAQFYEGFLKTKEAWLRWYGEDVQSYNAHGREIADYQYYLMKHIGFHSISSGSAPLGWYCECGTNIDIQYKRVTWMDSELGWDTVKNNIDEWTE